MFILSFELQKFNGFPWVMNWSVQIQNLERLTEFVKPTDELVTHHGLQFYIDYKTPIRARSMLSLNHPTQFQIAYVPQFYRLNSQMMDDINQLQWLSLGDSYGLFEFEDFQSLIKKYPIMADWRNQF